MTVLAILTPDGPRLADPAQPLLTADDLGVLRGESVFETVRIAAGRPALLAEHLERLAASAARLAITLPRGLEALAALAVGGWEETDGVLRLVCTKGPPGGRPVAFALVTAIPAETVRAREGGVTAVTLTLGVSASVRAEAPWLLGGVKATSYAVNMASLRHAETEGAQDAIWISSDGEVLEAPTATVAWVRDGVLITPPPIQVSILPGTTVALALQLLKTSQEIRRGTAAELAEADEVMLLSSIRGVAPVTALDGRELGIGPITAGLRDAVETALQRS
ncbi:MAG: aminotransferase class IV [Mycobacteriales bacterium]